MTRQMVLLSLIVLIPATRLQEAMTRTRRFSGDDSDGTGTPDWQIQLEGGF